MLKASKGGANIGEIKCREKNKDLRKRRLEIKFVKRDGRFKGCKRESKSEILTESKAPRMLTKEAIRYSL